MHLVIEHALVALDAARRVVRRAQRITSVYTHSLSRHLSSASHDSWSHRPMWLALTVVILAMMAWTGSLFFGVNVESSEGTPTPTKTPTPVNADDFRVNPPLSGAALLPTDTPTPTVTPPATFTPVPTPTPDLQPDNSPASWLVELVQARGLNPNGRYVVVDQDNQLMYVVDEGEELKRMNVTTGDPRYGWDTPAWFGVIGEYWGTFKGRGDVMADEGWWLFERGGNFLIHGLPYTLDKQGVKRYKDRNYLGALPASSGCIRLSPEDAEWFSAWEPAGTPIIILPLTHRPGGKY